MRQGTPHPGTALPFPLDVDKRRRASLPTQIVDAVAAGVRSGRLRLGDRLPGARTLAATLEVHRSTVDAAYAELNAQGFIHLRPRESPIVALDLQAAPQKQKEAKEKEQKKQELGFALAPSPPAFDDDDDEGAIALWGGTPDVSLLPRALLARAVREVLVGRKAEQRLSYGDVRGDPALRAGLVRLLREHRGVSIDDVVVTRGSQMALELCARVLVQPGDVVAVEDPGYGPARGAFLARGARLAPLPVDEQGVDILAFDRLTREVKVRALVLTPHHQYPTTVTLSMERRLHLLDACAKLGIAIVEDDYDHEFHYEGRPHLPLLADDKAGVVVSVGSLSKILAPGLRVGWVTGPRPFLDAVAHARRFVDRQGDHVMEAALALLLDDGEVARHARRMRRVYRARRDALVAALREAFPYELYFTVPRGGMALWVGVAARVDVDEWLARALQQGVKIQPTKSFYVDGSSRSFLRLGFAGHDEDTLREAVKRLRAALP